MLARLVVKAEKFSQDCLARAYLKLQIWTLKAGVMLIAKRNTFISLSGSKASETSIYWTAEVSLLFMLMLAHHCLLLEHQAEDQLL